MSEEELTEEAWHIAQRAYELASIVPDHWNKISSYQKACWIQSVKAQLKAALECGWSPPIRGTQ